MPQFDAWDAANALGNHLRQPSAELMVVIGAEQWCEKCRRLRPLFDSLCTVQMPAHVAWMWLDLEDHSDFLGGFIPPDLPLLLRWRQGVCVQAAVIEAIRLEQAPSERVHLRPLAIDGEAHVADASGAWVPLPALWHEFSSHTWTKG